MLAAQADSGPPLDPTIGIEADAAGDLHGDGGTGVADGGDVEAPPLAPRTTSKIGGGTLLGGDARLHEVGNGYYLARSRKNGHGSMRIP